MSLWREALGLDSGRKVKRRNSSYDAAKIGRLLADFQGSSGSADAELKGNLRVMRERCREMARNDPYVKRYIQLHKDNVVGPAGIAHQVKAMNVASGQMDVMGNDIVESAWAEFSQMGNCTADGRSSMIDLLNGVITAEARDGEAWVQVLRSPVFKHGIAFNQFEADLIDEQKNQKLRNGAEIRMGVEVDRFQRPIAYWMKERHPGDTDFASMTINDSRRIDAKNVIHIYEQVRPGQTRGEPRLAPALAAIKMLNGHREAELVAARMAASKMGFFTSESGEDVPADDYENGVGSVPIINAEPGTFHQLPTGVDFKPFNMDHPSTAFGEFQKGILLSIATSMGVSYASLSSDLSGTSYSSVRQGELEQREYYRGQQRYLVDHFLRPAYALWLQHVMEFGYIPIPAVRFQKFYSATEFRPRGWQWVDPLKEINAAVTGMHNGIMSPQDVATQYGNDFEETMKDWQAAQQISESYGQTLAFGPFGANEASKPLGHDQVEAQEEGQDDG